MNFSSDLAGFVDMPISEMLHCFFLIHPRDMIIIFSRPLDRGEGAGLL